MPSAPQSPQLIAVGAEHRDEIPLGRILKDPSAPFIQQVQETILIHIDIDKPGEGIGEHIPVPFLVAEKGVGVLGQNVVSLIIQHPHHPVLVGGAGGPGYGIDKAVRIHIKIGKGHRRVQFKAFICSLVMNFRKKKLRMTSAVWVTVLLP